MPKKSFLNFSLGFSEIESELQGVSVHCDITVGCGYTCNKIHLLTTHMHSLKGNLIPI